MDNSDKLSNAEQIRIAEKLFEPTDTDPFPFMTALTKTLERVEKQDDLYAEAMAYLIVILPYVPECGLKERVDKFIKKFIGGDSCLISLYNRKEFSC